jgi:hypothetical protein
LHTDLRVALSAEANAVPWAEWRNIFNEVLPTEGGVYDSSRQMCVLPVQTAAQLSHLDTF